MIIFQKISDFFKNLQQKSEDARRRWLWVFVISIMAVIFIFWLVSFAKNIRANLSPSSSPSPSSQEVAEAGRPSSDFLSIFIGGLKNTVSSIMSFLRPIAAAVARFFVTIFSFVLKAGDWLIHELTDVFNAAKMRLQSSVLPIETATRNLDKVNREIGAQFQSYFSLALAAISQK
ncbi:MAG: hypothetical protein Q8N90_04170 [bacterium]|nr:hypothetical protein [bacterium]